MSERDAQHTTRLLNRLSEGDGSVSEELLERIYAELHALATAHMGRQSPAHTLQPTALVHEAFLRLVDTPEASYASQGHFYAMASRVMRNVLVDHAREKNAEKRGGGRGQVPLDALATDGQAPAGYDILDVNECLESLAAVEPELVQVVEMRHFGGLTVSRMSELLGVSERTVERRLRAATAWLQRRLA